MEFVVTDRESIESGFVVKTRYIVISIHDPDKPRAKVRRQSGLQDVLALAFHDAEPLVKMTMPADIKLMTPEQAKQIWQLVRKWEKQVGTVVVHCEQGMSRSPAVAAALCKAMGGDAKKFWREYQPNLYVYRLVLEAADAKAGG